MTSPGRVHWIDPHLLVPVVNVRARSDDRKTIVSDVGEDRARLVEARDRDPHIVIRGKRAVHEIVEDRVFELLPPARIERLLETDAGSALRKTIGDTVGAT